MTSRTGTVRAALLKGLLRESLPCSAGRELFYHCSPQMRNEFHVTDCRAPEVICLQGRGRRERDREGISCGNDHCDSVTHCVLYFLLFFSSQSRQAEGKNKATYVWGTLLCVSDGSAQIRCGMHLLKMTQLAPCYDDGR